MRVSEGSIASSAKLGAVENHPMEQLMYQATQFDFQCVNVECLNGGHAKKATHGRVLKNVVQPICESCAAWMARNGSKILPLDEAMKCATNGAAEDDYSSA